MFLKMQKLLKLLPKPKALKKILLILKALMNLQRKISLNLKAKALMKILLILKILRKIQQNPKILRKTANHNLYKNFTGNDNFFDLSAMQVW